MEIGITQEIDKEREEDRRKIPFKVVLLILNYLRYWEFPTMKNFKWSAVEMPYPLKSRDLN